MTGGAAILMAALGGLGIVALAAAVVVVRRRARELESFLEQLEAAELARRLGQGNGL